MSGIVVDLFAGVGGLSWGFQEVGYQVKVAVEKDAVHAATYSKNHESTKVINSLVDDVAVEDIIEITGTDIEIICGGPPCQSFSNQGRQAKDDPRGLLIWSFFKKVSFLRPKHFVMESVPGIISPKFQGVFQSLLDKFNRIGYRTSWRQLNAAEFGTPQDRNRIIVIGTLPGYKLPCIPKPKSSDEWVTVQDAIADLPEVDNFPELLKWDTLDYGLLGKPSKYIEKLNKSVSEIKAITGMQRTIHADEVKERFSRTLPNKIEPISRFKKLAWSGRSNTLKASYDNSRHTACRPIHPIQPRVITVREAARLHGYPDNFVFTRTKAKAYQQIGNSVPPLLSLAIAQEMLKVC
jgi:DNA (cytosine-5)-methyltransferase 1